VVGHQPRLTAERDQAPMRLRAPGAPTSRMRASCRTQSVRL
jgi:hypothetical protein